MNVLSATSRGGSIHVTNDEALILALKMLIALGKAHPLILTDPDSDQWH